jgi:regulator of RNase E activity RraA
MKLMVGILDRSVVRTDDVLRPSEDIVRQFRKLSDSAGLVARALDQFGVQGSIPSAYLKPLHPGRAVVGPAITVRNIPVRNVPLKNWNDAAQTRLGEREAHFRAQPGDVVVIDGCTVYPASCLGSVSLAMASQLGVSGAVVSGAVTGVAGIASADIPVWARGGTTITGHQRVETIEINGPIGIQGVRVEPGDLVVADDSGVTFVPAGIAEQVLNRAIKLKGLGAGIRALLRRRADREALRAELAAFIAGLKDSASDNPHTVGT